MNTEFVPYEPSLALKELGFDEPCLGYYIELRNPVEGLLKIGLDNDYLQALLYQQAFRWFREKCLLEGIVEQADDFYWYKFSVYFYGKEGKQKISNGLEFKTYEEAELACLKKLIEIVKQ
jgi:hypothetical protein